jgi:hypothetical protein
VVRAVTPRGATTASGGFDVTPRDLGTGPRKACTGEISGL